MGRGSAPERGRRCLPAVSPSCARLHGRAAGRDVRLGGARGRVRRGRDLRDAGERVATPIRRYCGRAAGARSHQMSGTVWTPSSERIKGANITRFARERGLPADYGELWQWSVENLEEFWAAIWDEWVDADAPYERVLGRREMPGAEWFPGARLNYAKHVFRGRDDDALAIQHASESRELASWTWGDLKRETARIATILRELGVEKGDRVAAYMPNIPETVAAFVATASIGE